MEATWGDRLAYCTVRRNIVTQAMTQAHVKPCTLGPQRSEYDSFYRQQDAMVAGQFAKYFAIHTLCGR